MAHTSFGRRGRFWPTRRPLFHAAREEALFVLISVDMVDLHARPLPPQRPRSAGRPSYRNRTELREPCSAEQPGVGRKAVDVATARLPETSYERVSSNQSERCEANSSEIPCTAPGCAICEKAFGPALPVSTKLTAAITVPQSEGSLLTACSQTAEADSSATRRHPRPRSPSEKARRLRRAILFPGPSRPRPPRPDSQSRRKSGIPPEPF